ncbi:transposase [Vagococcus carniphilus]|uniref:transposase n=1 Tax=Vagococcus carniphilus TaxID=218144 RepID=UPI0035DAADB7
MVKNCFPSFKIVTSRFHLIQHVNRTFNFLRIKEMNQLKRHDQNKTKQYRRLKRYWRLLLKDSSELNYKRFYYRPLLKRLYHQQN